MGSPRCRQTTGSSSCSTSAPRIWPGSTHCLPDVASEKAQAALAHIRNPHDIDTARLVETAGMVIEARAARLSERFQACQQQLCTPPGEAAPPVGHAFLNGVAAAARRTRGARDAL